MYVWLSLTNVWTSKVRWFKCFFMPVSSWVAVSWNVQYITNVCKNPLKSFSFTLFPQKMDFLKKLTCRLVEDHLFFAPSPPEIERKDILVNMVKIANCNPLILHQHCGLERNHIRRLSGMEIHWYTKLCYCYYDDFHNQEVWCILINQQLLWYVSLCICILFLEMSKDFILHKIWFHFK